MTTDNISINITNFWVAILTNLLRKSDSLALEFLMKESGPWSNSVAAMARLYDKTCMILGEKIGDYSK